MWNKIKEIYKNNPEPIDRMVNVCLVVAFIYSVMFLQETL